MKILIYVNLCCVAVTLIFLVIAGIIRRKHRAVSEIPKGLMRIFYPGAEILYMLLGQKYARKTQDTLRKLYPQGRDDSGNRFKEADSICTKTICWSLIIFLLTNGLCVVLGVSRLRNPPVENGYYIFRNNYGEGEKNVNLLARTGKKEFPVDITVAEQRYTSEEMVSVMAECNRRIEEDILGSNGDLLHITQDLNFFTVIDTYSVQVSWKTDDYSVVGMDGQVKNTGLKSPVDVCVTAVCTYFDTVWEHQVFLRVHGRELSDEAAWLQQVQTAVLNQEKKTQNLSYLKLPDNVMGEPVHWEGKADYTLWILGFFSLLLMVLPFLKQTERIRQMLNVREKQLAMDYPIFVHKFVLLLSAGMTARAVWMRMIADYENKLSQGGEHRYVYDEMLLTAHEMKHGVNQMTAYENFGRRCGQNCYLKFCSVLIQSIRTGARGLGHVLTDAAAEAELMRRESAKCLGEEAGTKLLFPMMILLIMVMVMLMIPAFMTMDL